MSYDPTLRLVEQTGEIDELKGRVDAHRELLQQDHASPHGGLHDHPVAVEDSIWKKFSPWRNRWPEVLEFDFRVAELEQQQAAIAEELRQLRDREIAAPGRDEDRLATWLTGGEQGPRPEPELPKVREEIERRQEDHKALIRATERVLAEKTAFVEKHRKRLLSDAAGRAREALANYHAAIDALAEARDELRGARQEEVWAALYPNALAGQEAPDSLCGGRKRPLRKLGLESPVAPARVVEALHDDADWLRGAVTEEQYAAIHKANARGLRHVAHWINTPEAKNGCAKRPSRSSGRGGTRHDRPAPGSDRALPPPPPLLQVRSEAAAV